MKRYLVLPLNFDTRHLSLEDIEDIEDNWKPERIERHNQNKAQLITRLKLELGELNFDIKVENFKDLGSSPFSIIAHHNDFFRQARYAFIHGFYYPALTAACALGERILNHLFLDLRANFPRAQHDKKSHSRRSIDDWSKAINVLNEWNVFQQDEVIDAFEGLKTIRHRSLHFNQKTATSSREDALKALNCLSTVIEKQFGFQFAKVIPGSKGAFFFQKEAEDEPFINHYYLSQCAYVSPYYRMKIVNDIWLVFDYKEKQSRILSDEEFLAAFQSRSDDQIVPDNIPWNDNLAVVALLPTGAQRVDYDPSKFIQ